MSDGLLKHIHRLFRAEWGAIGAVVTLVLIASLVSEKIGADGLFGAFLAGVGGRLKYIPSKGSMAIGLGIAARAGMGVIWAMVAHNAKIINDPIFTGLIIMAVITSMTAGFIRNLLPSSYGSEDELHTNNN